MKPSTLLLIPAVFVLAGAFVTAAAPDYALEEIDWGIDFVHAGSAEPSAMFAEITSGGACVLDFDGDGWEDLLLVNGRYWNRTLDDAIRPVSELYRNVAGTGFELAAGELAEHAWAQGCAVGDFDGDADPDVLFTTWGSGNLLFRNDGGSFTNITDASGVNTGYCGLAPCWSTSASFLDFDLDGDLDLFVLNYLDWDGVGESGPTLYPRQCNTLYRNDANVFVDVTPGSGTADCEQAHFALAVGDVDGDHDTDIYIASDASPNALLINEGNGVFVDRAEETGVLDIRNGMGAALADYDDDGRPDLTVTNFDEEGFGLHTQTSPLRFRDRYIEAGLERVQEHVGWGTEFIDLDRDGRLDLAYANGNVNITYASTGTPYHQIDLLFRNRGDGTFDDWTDTHWAPAPRAASSRGLAFADFDRDGYLDVVVVNNPDMAPHVARSVRGPNNFITVQALPGAHVNGDAVGTKITVTADGRTVTREVVGQASFLSQSSREIGFGVANATVVDRIEVRFPDGRTHSVTDVLANRFISVDPTGIVTTRFTRPLVTMPTSTTVEPGGTIALEATVLHAGSGNLSVLWTVDGVTTSGPTLSFTGGAVAHHDARVRITDDAGFWDEVDFTIIVGDEHPVVVASIPESADRLNAVSFDASLSYDPDGDSVDVAWTIDGVNYAGAVVTHRFTTLGARQAIVTVTDELGQTAEATYVVTVANLLPDLTPPPNMTGNVGRVFTFADSEATDADGHIVAWRWSFADGSRKVYCIEATPCVGLNETERLSEPVFTRSFATTGVQEALFTMLDNDLGASTVSVFIDVHGFDPVAAFTAPAHTTRLDDVTFDGTGSLDPEGTVVQWHWAFGDGAHATGATVSHRYTALGTFEVTLTVTDDHGYTAATAAVVEVRNVPPTAVVLGVGLANLNQPLDIDGTLSDDPDAGSLSYEWSVAATPVSASPSLTWSFDTTGLHHVTLRVTDVDGASATAVHAVTVVSDLVTAIVLDKASYRENEPVTGNVTLHFANGAPATGAAVDGVLTWRIEPTPGWRPHRADQPVATVTGLTDPAGRLAFATDPVADEPLPAAWLPNTIDTPAASYRFAYHDFGVNATWSGNAGADAQRVNVVADPTPAAPAALVVAWPPLYGAPIAASLTAHKRSAFDGSRANDDGRASRPLTK